MFAALLLFSAVLCAKPVKDDLLAFRIFDGQGKMQSYNKVAAALLKSDVVFFGELHNNAIAHWIQLRFTRTAFENKGERLFLAAEMFEADNQSGMDSYLNGTIDEKAFKEQVRLWPNYETDYKPLVEFARTNKLKFICANIPRKYASMVYKKGLDSLSLLSADEKKWIAPLPIAYDGSLGCYKRMMEMAGGHGGDNLPKAQAIKDATMAYFIAQNFPAGGFGIHFNGSWHSEYGEGIQWYLKKYAPNLKLASITTVSQKNPAVLEKENKGKADFVIVVADDMTTTH